jgi:hypothetical protein
MCRGRRARILLHLHIQLEKTVLRANFNLLHGKVVQPIFSWRLFNHPGGRRVAHIRFAWWVPV